MAQIVLIDIPTKRNFNEIWDINSIHDDDVKLGNGYEGFKIITVEGLTIKEVRDILLALQPEQTIAFRSIIDSGVWSLIEPEYKPVWKDNSGKWNFLETRPKYSLNLNLLKTDVDSLADINISKTDKIIILQKAQEKISLLSENNMEVTDLNK